MRAIRRYGWIGREGGRKPEGGRQILRANPLQKLGIFPAGLQCNNEPQGPT